MNLDRITNLDIRKVTVIPKQEDACFAVWNKHEIVECLQKGMDERRRDVTKFLAYLVGICGNFRRRMIEDANVAEKLRENFQIEFGNVWIAGKPKK